MAQIGGCGSLPFAMSVRNSSPVRAMIWSIGTSPVTNGFAAGDLAVQALLERGDVLRHAFGEPHHFLAARVSV